MLKVIQVKIQEQVSCKKKVSKSTWLIDRKTGSTDRNTGLQNFKFGPTVVQAQKGLGSQIYFF